MSERIIAIFSIIACLTLFFRVAGAHAATDYFEFVCQSETSCGPGGQFRRGGQEVELAYCEGIHGYYTVDADGSGNHRILRTCVGVLVPITQYADRVAEAAFTKANNGALKLDNSTKEELKNALETLKRELATQINSNLEKLPVELLQTIEFEEFARRIRCDTLKELTESGIQNINLSRCK